MFFAQAEHEEGAAKPSGKQRKAGDDLHEKGGEQHPMKADEAGEDDADRYIHREIKKQGRGGSYAGGLYCGDGKLDDVRERGDTEGNDEAVSSECRSCHRCAVKSGFTLRRAS